MFQKAMSQKLMSQNHDLQELHQYCFQNKWLIQSSTLIGCFSCLRVYPANLITEYTDIWEEDGSKQQDEKTATGLCFYCECDCVLPNSKVKDIDVRILKEMKDCWFANIIEREPKNCFTNIEVKRCEDDLKQSKDLEGKIVHRLKASYDVYDVYDVWANVDGNENNEKQCIVEKVSIEKVTETVAVLESAKAK